MIKKRIWLPLRSFLVYSGRVLSTYDSRYLRALFTRVTVSFGCAEGVCAPKDGLNQGGGGDALGKWYQSGSMLRSHDEDPLMNASSAKFNPRTTNWPQQIPEIFRIACSSTGRGSADVCSRRWRAQGWCRPSCIPITVILILIVFVVLLSLLDNAADKHLSNSTNPGNEFAQTCMDSCKINLVETIPSEVVYPNDSVSHPSTYNSWMELIASARASIEIVSFRWNMTREAGYTDDVAKEGEDVFKALLEAGRDRGVRLRFARPSSLSSRDVEYLSKNANAEDGRFDYSSILGSGTLHTKLWLVDRTHVYIGSANFVWNSLSQYKELGLLIANCSFLANDIAKVFDVYWKLSEDGKIPATWPESLTTKINLENPMNLTSDGNKYRAFLASSPPALSPKGRTDELEAVLHCIDKAEKFVYITVARYLPLFDHAPKIKYWPIIDDALRSAAIERKVNIRLLIPWQDDTRLSGFYFLESLVALTESYENVKIEVKLFTVPKYAERDKVTGLNHHKYMVTDIAAFIGMSNWSGDYFVDTAGIAMIFEDVGQKNEGSIRQQLEDVFHRDWNSGYAHPLNELHSPRKMP